MAALQHVGAAAPGPVTPAESEDAQAAANGLGTKGQGTEGSGNCAHAIRQRNSVGAPGTGAAIVSPGTLPHKRGSASAEVLARLLAGERLTGLEALDCASTMRLAAVVDYLQAKYGWNIERTEKAAGCRDGRVVRISVYWLAPEVIKLAMAAGAMAWCVEVRTARRELRAKAALAYRAAARANTSRRGKAQPGQMGLFEGEAAAA